jgi:hypothetical protein
MIVVSDCWVVVRSPAEMTCREGEESVEKDRAA